MMVNIISESQWLPTLYGGTHTAFLSVVHALRKQKVKIVINSLKKSSITHIHTFGFFSLYKLLTNKHVVITAHMMPETLIGTFKGDRYWFGFLRSYLRFFYNKADLIIVLNPKTEKDLRNLGVIKKTVMIPNPINSERFRRNLLLREKGRQQYGLTEENFIIVGVGHFIPRKGIEDFILLAKQLPTFTFIWVGGKPMKTINANIEKKGNLLENLPSNLIITGNVPYDQMPLYYDMADVYLCLSFQEIAPMAIIEAATCNLPLVLRDLKEYHEIYNNSYIPCRTNKEMQTILKDLHDKKNLYIMMVQKSKKLATRFSEETIGKMLYNTYLTLQN